MKKLQKGFTLIELMIVVAIIAILAAVAAPRFGAQIAKAKDAKALEVIGSWRSGFNLAYADNAIYATKLSEVADAVDQGTKDKTTGEEVANATSASVTAGKPTTVNFGISGTTTDASIIITTTDVDSKNIAWNTK